MKTFKLLARYMKKHLIVFFLTVLLVVGLNYIRSIVPKLTSGFVAIIERKPLIESEIPKFLLWAYTGESLQAQLFTTAFLIAFIALIREVINIIMDVNIYSISETVGCSVQTDYFNKVQD